MDSIAPPLPPSSRPCRSVRRSRRAALLAVLGALLLAGAEESMAWSADGHRIVCEIAWQRLAPEARQFVTGLIRREPGRLFSQTCMWADEVRETTHPQTRPYHYADVPAGAGTFEMARDCGDPKRRCLVWAIDHYARILADPGRPAAARREALKFVAHFVGDIHNPLHVGRPEDRGGNTIHVSFFEDAGTPDRPLTLHRVWDAGILQRAGFRWPDTAHRLNARITDAEAAEWATLDVVAWANDSHRIADTFAYPALPDDRAIGNGYYRPALGHASVLLQQAGVRLAYLLTRAAAGSLDLPKLQS